MIALSYSFKGLFSSVISLTFILDFEYCSGGDLLTISISWLRIRERMLNRRYVLREKDGLTMRVLLLSLRLSGFGCW